MKKSNIEISEKISVLEKQLEEIKSILTRKD